MRRATLQLIALASSAFVGWVATAAIAAQARPAEKAVDKAPLAEEVFTNVRVLRGIPVDEFMGTMGFFSASLGMSCEDCHGASDTTWENYARDVSPKKATARRMIQMMTSINQTSFGGRAVVTCYTCHRGGAKPKVTPSLALLYGATTTDEADDVVQAAKDAPSVEQILGKYIQAIGGQQRLAAMTTVVGRGSSAGYGPEGTRPIEIFAKAPSQRTMILHTLDGDSTTTYDGRVAWSAVPHKPVPVLMLAGSELDGAKLDAELMFPARIKDTLTGWRAGSPAEIDDKPMQVVQGSRPGGLLATFYFDSESGLLTRLVRYANSRVGRLPTQVDYSDYRDVNGIKFPYHTNNDQGQVVFDLTVDSIKVNAGLPDTDFK